MIHNENKERINTMINSLLNMGTVMTFLLMGENVKVQIDETSKLLGDFKDIDDGLVVFFECVKTGTLNQLQDVQLQEIECLIKARGLLVEKLMRLKGYNPEMFLKKKA